MAKKNKKNERYIYLIISLVIIFTVTIIIEITLLYGKPREQILLEEEGYNTTVEDAFYKKIVTNNTLDDFYNNVKEKKDTAYEEYYFSKESYQFIELKMVYQSETTTTLNINANIETNEIEYTYELSNDSEYLLINGTSSNNYSCEVVSEKNIKRKKINEECSKINDELNVFLERRNELLSNEKIRELIN